LVADAGGCVIRRFDPPPERSMAPTNVGKVVLGKLRCTSRSLLNRPHGVTASADLTTLVVADTHSHCIRALHNAGTARATESVLAGVCGKSGYSNGHAAHALFDYPHVVRFSKFNENIVFIGEQGNGALRMLDTNSGTVSTIIGNRTTGYRDGNASSALLNYVHDIRELDRETLAIVEYATNRLRRVTSAFSSPQIDTIAGSGSSTIYSMQYQDGLADAARFNTLAGLAVRNDTIVLAEYRAHRIRVVLRPRNRLSEASEPDYMHRLQRQVLL
jgi:hypothetical protein